MARPKPTSAQLQLKLSTIRAKLSQYFPVIRSFSEAFGGSDDEVSDVISDLR